MKISQQPQIIPTPSGLFPILDKNLSEFLFKRIVPKPQLKIIFFGNTRYSNIGLRIVNKIYPISLVVTLPDSPVKNLAEKFNIPVLETKRLDETIIKRIKNLNPDFLIVEDYGLILPKKLLDIPKYAPLNIHHSLLPKYRGPSPAPFVILNGDKISGVSIIRMIEEVDAGDILAQKEYTLSEDETTDSLLTKLNEMGGELVVEVIKQYLEGSAKPTPQDNSKASLTKHFTRQDGYFDINNPPSLELLDRMIRAYYPWPGVWTRWNGKIVKFLPNQMLQMEGKKAIPFKDFLNGYPDFPLK